MAVATMTKTMMKAMTVMAMTKAMMVMAMTMKTSQKTTKN
jgi:hypothetical protein